MSEKLYQKVDLRSSNCKGEGADVSDTNHIQAM